jgi:hypothetical protein
MSHQHVVADVYCDERAYCWCGASRDVEGHEWSGSWDDFRSVTDPVPEGLLVTLKGLVRRLR